MFNAAIIGLGNIGFQLGLDPLRKDTWSHVHAYGRCPDTTLSAAVEIDLNRVMVFHQHFSHVPVYNTIRELMERTNVQIVSICTPPETHYPLAMELLAYDQIRGVFCEKPIATGLKEAQLIVEKSKKRNIVLSVNHLRSWDDTYLAVREKIQKGEIGKIRGLGAWYTSRIYNMGSHLFDTLRLLIQKEPHAVSGISNDPDAPDPTISGWIQYEDNIVCTINARGKREDYIFEIDIIGEEGRIRISESEGQDYIDVFRYENSQRFSGYRELFFKKKSTIKRKDRFVAAISDICRVINKEKKETYCSGRNGLITVALCAKLIESAKQKGIPVKIDV